MTNRGKWAEVLQFLFAGDVYFDLSEAPKVESGWTIRKQKRGRNY
jgi:predicted nicotinamide N-methyase